MNWNCSLSSNFVTGVFVTVYAHREHPRSQRFPEYYGGGFGGVLSDHLLPISNAAVASWLLIMINAVLTISRLQFTDEEPLNWITESQNQRMVGVGRDLCGSSSPTPPVKAGSPTAGCTGPCPDRSWISLEKETPQPPWAACSSAFSCCFVVGMLQLLLAISTKKVVS